MQSQEEIWDAYRKQHCRCPRCGRVDAFEQTCVGYIANNLETARDENRADCRCGWSGIVHDLLPAD